MKNEKSQREAERLNSENKKTWIYNTEYTTDTDCSLCGKSMNMKFHKNGKPMDNTKLYKQKSSQKEGITHRHRNVLVCYYNSRE